MRHDPSPRPTISKTVPSPVAETLAVVLLAATLLWAVARPRRMAGGGLRCPSSGLARARGSAAAETGRLRSVGPRPDHRLSRRGSVLADMCARYGLFRAAGAWLAIGSRGRPLALLALVFTVASVVTAVLSLDATVVLLTPAVLSTVARLRLRAKPHAYACTHLANFGLVAPAGLESHQSVGISREWYELRPLRGHHGPAFGSSPSRSSGSCCGVSSPPISSGTARPESQHPRSRSSRVACWRSPLSGSS